MNLLRENDLLRRALKQVLMTMGDMSEETALALIEADLAVDDPVRFAAALERLDASEVGV